MIELGLSRIARLVQSSPLPWKAIHIAGTNGKGSITSYLSALLAAAGVRCGSFSSPHLIDRWDCITINDRVVRESVFRQIEDKVKFRNQSLGIGATEFELLTATAFEIFTLENVDVGIVEVGMGGRLDATNVLNDSNVLVSIIAKIGYDHQAILGDTIEKITREKAGIMKPGVPCVVDGTNDPAVRSVLEEVARETQTPLAFTQPEAVTQEFPELGKIFERLNVELHQQANIACAVTALGQKNFLPPSLPLPSLFQHIPKTPRAGRLHEVSLKPLIARKQPVLLDGAHNPQSAHVLCSYVDRNLRKQPCTRGNAHGSNHNVTWVIAASQGKDTQELFSCMLKPGDNVAVVEFGPVDGMPWVRSVESAELLSVVRSGRVSMPNIARSEGFGGNIVSALTWADEISKSSGCGRSGESGPMVVAGSLYLVSDVLRLLREANNNNIDVLETS
ncbi:dihydrofolate synthetase Fol3 [Blastomyces gilchristii SLH14081]|uniref:Dihydrofolate synthetase Fol3 n=2 Tax=Blastomyces gilchristii (strain SLH14081) TaxID=559298 RepID=A0A179UKN3_BLAGS|nr:dihydrofolate synthetase Fol3 [Blastomyces gilchristii SLH14081]OAT08615.1 dihydrofolate synthetase Fol3 [Blastomyces gilchristii SLH14081]